MENDFGIARSLEDGSVALQIIAQFGGIGDIAVMRHRKLSLIAGHGERLGVQKIGISGRRIASVPNGEIAGQPAQNFGGEQVRYMPHAAVEMEMAAVARSN